MEATVMIGLASLLHQTFYVLTDIANGVQKSHSSEVKCIGKAAKQGDSCKTNSTSQGGHKLYLQNSDSTLHIPLSSALLIQIYECSAPNFLQTGMLIL